MAVSARFPLKFPLSGRCPRSGQNRRGSTAPAGIASVVYYNIRKNGVFLIPSVSVAVKPPLISVRFFGVSFSLFAVKIQQLFTARLVAATKEAKDE